MQGMAERAETRTLADTGGLVVTDDGRRVLVFDRCTGALAELAFVLGVVALGVGGFGLVALVVGVPSRTLGAVSAAVGLAFGAVTYLVVRKIAGRRGQPLHECRPVAVIDRKLGCSVTAAVRWCHWIRCVSRESSKSVRARSNSSRSHRAEPTFSSAANPFDGGVGNVDDVLSAVVRGG
jgi:hypothetical protein